MKREEFMVAAIENGTVIDHIPCAKLFEVGRLLHLEEIKTSSIMVGFNQTSHKMGRKSIIKISDKFFSDAELNRLAIVAPNVSLCIIKDYEVVEKKKVTLPGVLRNIVRCANPKCITNNEPMNTLFSVTDAEKGTILCHYCNKEQELANAKLV